MQVKSCCLRQKKKKKVNTAREIKPTLIVMVDHSHPE